ncbi:MAG: DUF1552 domain-containing protein [Planctomyces sp.]
MKLPRRHFLKGPGAAVLLPFLPSIASAAARKAAEKPARRMVIVYLPNGIVRRCFFPGEEQAELPDFIGGFDADRTKAERRLKGQPGIRPLQLTSTLQPLAELSNDLTMLIGLDRSFKHGQDVHAQGASCYLTSLSPQQAADSGVAHPKGRTLDQIVGDHVGHSTVFNTLEISCNGFTAPKEPIEFDNISWYGPGRIAPAVRDPQKLYERLFLREDYRRHVSSVTDLVLADARDLSRQLAADDRRQMDEFMELIRGIEQRIKRMDEMLRSADVKVPKNEILPRGEYIRLQMDLMLAALQTGITNVCTFMIGPERWDATLMYEGVFEQPVQHHNMTHNQKGDGWKDLQKIDLFHMQQFAWLIRRMKEIREPDGSSLLDNSIVSLGAGLGDGATHQYYDLPMLIAGTAQGQIRQGRTIQLAPGTLTSSLWLTFAQLMGVEMKSYADSSGVLTDLWT